MGDLHFRMPPPRTAAAIARSLGRRAAQAAAAAAAGGAAALAPRRRGAAAQQDPRRRGDPPPLRRLQHVLRVRPRPVDDLHLRVLPPRRARPSRRPRRTSTASSSTSCASRRATGCSTSAAAGAAWSGMPRGRACTSSAPRSRAEQAPWAQEAIRREGLQDLAEVRHSDYRDVRETGFDAVSSIGLTEHIGVRNYPAYFGFIQDHLRTGGMLLNHCITRPDNRRTSTGAFIDRYVFPDGELTGSGTIIARRAGRRARGAARGEPARALRPHPRRLVRQPASTTGMPASTRSARPRPGSGASTWPARGSGSSATSSSCTRCWRSSSTTVGEAGLPLRPWWNA